MGQWLSIFIILPILLSALAVSVPISSASIQYFFQEYETLNTAKNELLVQAQTDPSTWVAIDSRLFRWESREIPDLQLFHLVGSNYEQ